MNTKLLEALGMAETGDYLIVSGEDLSIVMVNVEDGMWGFWDSTFDKSGPFTKYSVAKTFAECAWVIM